MTTPLDGPRSTPAAFERSRHRLHPLIAAAALSVTAVSMTGIAAMTGLLPGAASQGIAAPATQAVPTVPAAPLAQVALAAAPATLGTTTAVATPNDRAAATAPAQATRRPPSTDGSYASVAAAAPQRTMRVRHTSDMATVESVRAVTQRAASSGIGTIGGSVIGGALGSQIGKGNGRAAMAALGAVGGGMLGHEVEQRINGTRVYDVTLRMDNGARRTVRYERDPGFRVGERVRAGDAGLRSV